jgi:hypothetical protein
VQHPAGMAGADTCRLHRVACDASWHWWWVFWYQKTAPSLSLDLSWVGQLLRQWPLGGPFYKGLCSSLVLVAHTCNPSHSCCVTATPSHQLARRSILFLTSEAWTGLSPLPRWCARVVLLAMTGPSPSPRYMDDTVMA